MSRYEVSNMEQLKENLSALHGAVIVDTYVETDDWDAWPGLVLKLTDKNGRKFLDSVLVSQDMEGNGPGVLIGLENIVELVGA